MGALVALQLTMPHDIKAPNSAVYISRGIFLLILGAMGHDQAAETTLLLPMSTAWSLAVIRPDQTWARFGRELSKDNSTAVQ